MPDHGPHPSALPPGSGAPDREALLRAVQDMAGHARRQDMGLADEALTEIFGRLNGWPVDELDRLGGFARG